MKFRFTISLLLTFLAQESLAATEEGKVAGYDLVATTGKQPAHNHSKMEHGQQGKRPTAPEHKPSGALDTLTVDAPAMESSINSNVVQAMKGSRHCV